MSKRGTAVTSTMVYIALALVVIVIGIFLFGGRAKVFDKTVSQTCTEMNGIVSDAKGKCNDIDYIVPRISKDIPLNDKDNRRCCTKLG